MIFYSSEKYVSSISYNKIFGYLIPTLVTIVGANVQGTTKPLIETHKVSLCTFLLATNFYYIALAADYKCQRNQANSSQFWGLIAVIFGSLSAVSLISTFVPHSIGDTILYIFWISAAIIITVHQYGRFFMDACHWLYQKILKPIFLSILNWYRANDDSISSTGRPQAPV